MPKLDPFSAQIVQLVRNMPDEAILALVREKLGAVEPVGVAAVAPAPPARKRAARAKVARKPAAPKAAKAAAVKAVASAPKVAPKAASKVAPKASPRAAAKAAPKKARVGGKRVSPQRLKVLEAVERAVKGSKGMSASDVARATGVGQVRVATALRELKHAKRIFQGGDRRFARYAADQRAADQASLTARRTASGPVVKKRSAKG